MLEVSDPAGRPVCRFEEFLATATQHSNPAWPKGDNDAAQQLQDHALTRASEAILTNTLPDLHGHRYDLT
jgi:hypothetical protein